MWQLPAAIAIVAVAAGGYAMLERSWRINAEQRAASAEVARDVCRIELDLMQEGATIDNAIPDDLGGVGIPDSWLLPAP